MGETGIKRGQGCDRRAAIAEATLSLIAEGGLEALRTRDVAGRVGINIATLHYHVPTKEALIQLVAESLRREFAAQPQRRPRAGLSPMRQLEMEFEDFRESLETRPATIHVVNALTDLGRRDPAIGGIMAPVEAFWRGQFRDILAAGLASGDFRPDLDPDAGSGILTGALRDFWRRSANDLAAFDRLAAELVRGVRHPSVPASPLPMETKHD